MKKLKPALIGFLQAVGAVAYCSLVVGALSSFEKIFFNPPGFFGSLFILMLLVFSAALSGSIVFGYAAYLALNKRIKEALSVLVFTLLYSLLIILLIIIFIAILT